MSHTGIAALLALKLACCGGLLLFASGAISIGAAAAWLADGVVVAAWIALLVAALIAVRLWLRRSQPSRKEN